MIDCKIKEAIPRTTQAILKSIEKTKRSKAIETHFFPSRENIIKSIHDLTAILYPGYFADSLCEGNLPYYVGSIVDHLFHELSREITKSLSVHHEEGADSEKRRGKAIELTVDFMGRLPAIRELLDEDVQAAYDGDPAAKDFAEIIIAYPGLEAITVYRLAHELHALGVPLIPRMMSEWAHQRTGIDIHPGAKIGRSFFIDHGTGVVIGETTEIGNSVKIYQGVTLGALSFPKDEQGNLIRGKKRHPTVEDNVVIYANATVLGADTVLGEGSVIGGNVWITESIPPHTKVVIETPQQRFITKK
jgi:serine O-acetyltransferase